MATTVSHFIAMPFAKLSGFVLAMLKTSELVNEIPLNDGVRYEISHPLSGDEIRDCGSFEVVKIERVPKRLLSILDLELIDEGALSAWSELRIVSPDEMTEESRNKQRELFTQLRGALPGHVYIVQDEPNSIQSASSNLSKISDIIRHGGLPYESQDAYEMQEASGRTKRGRPSLIEDKSWRDTVLDVLTAIKKIKHEDPTRTYKSIYIQLGAKYRMAPRTIREWRTKYHGLDELND